MLQKLWTGEVQTLQGERVLAAALHAWVTIGGHGTIQNMTVGIGREQGETHFLQSMLTVLCYIP